LVAFAKTLVTEDEMKVCRNTRLWSYWAIWLASELISFVCCSTLSSDELEAVTPELLKQHQRPNTYILTKAVAEKLVEEHCGDIPCCVIRPTIVAGSYQEPVPVSV